MKCKKRIRILVLLGNKVISSFIIKSGMKYFNYLRNWVDMKPLNHNLFMASVLFLCSKVYQGVYTHVSIFEAYAFVASA
jgi:hypothetical protein